MTNKKIFQIPVEERPREKLLRNGANEVIHIRVVSIGLVNTTQVHPREVFADPLTDSAPPSFVGNGNTAKFDKYRFKQIRTWNRIIIPFVYLLPSHYENRTNISLDKAHTIKFLRYQCKSKHFSVKN